jgi:hypothetical protein
VGKSTISSIGGDGDRDGDADDGERYLVGVGTKEEVVVLGHFRAPQSGRGTIASRSG